MPPPTAELTPEHLDAASAERTRNSPIGWFVVGALGVLALGMIPAVTVYLFATAQGVLFSEHFPTLFAREWYPREEIFGLLPLILGTVSTSIFGLVLSVPLGLFAVIYFRFYAPRRVTRWGESTLGMLSGLPSVIFGLFGTVWLIPIFGPSLLVAGLVLAMMIVPTFAMLALAALRQIPDETLEAAGALGLRKEQVIRRIALVVTRPQLIAAAAVSLTRALGEALAVEMVCGNVASIPTSISDPVRSLTTTLVQEFEYATGTHRESLHLVALFVILVAAGVATVALRVGKRGPA